ncbi:MAG: hypothetical protein Q8T08_05245 [Ignavibacteria bacterium]|nr:hypothetical protein [Ignavibacteria bacterium]
MLFFCLGGRLHFTIRHRNKALFISGNKRINDETLAALTILIAASDPRDKELIVNLILVILG